jgi:predicted ATPase
LKAENNWYVITGGPCCGKTTTVRLLATRGYRTTVEEARHYLNTQRARGRTIGEIKGDHREFQLSVLKMQIEQEASLPPEEIVFLDRAIPDARAYYRFLNLPEDKILTEALAKVSYKKVFILDPLPLVHDYARVENEAAQAELQSLITEFYTGLGFPIMKVPVMFPEKRAVLILANL